jgi:hypothetical protein
LRLAAVAAFLMFRRAAAFCRGVVMRRKVRTLVRGCTELAAPRARASCAA